jgi:hypothetical protein
MRNFTKDGLVSSFATDMTPAGSVLTAGAVRTASTADTQNPVNARARRSEQSAIPRQPRRVAFLWRDERAGRHGPHV